MKSDSDLSEVSCRDLAKWIDDDFKLCPKLDQSWFREKKYFMISKCDSFYMTDLVHSY